MIWICCSVDQSLEVPTGNQGVVDTSQSRVMFSVVHGRTSSTAVSNGQIPIVLVRKHRNMVS